MTDPRHLLTIEFWRAHALEAGYGAVALLAFVLGLIATFPYTAALATILAPSGLSIKSDAQSLSFPLGASLRNVRLILAAQRGGAPVLASRTLTVAPTLGSLFFGRPGVRLRAELYDGAVDLSIRLSRGSTIFQFAATDLDLARYHVPGPAPIGIAGRLSGEGTGLLPPKDPLAGKGEAELTVNGLALTLVGGLPGLKLGDAMGRLKLANEKLTIVQFQSKGGEVDVSAHGTVRLMPEPGDSPVAIEVTMMPSKAARKRFGVLMALLPHPPAAGPYHVTGTLRSLRLR